MKEDARVLFRREMLCLLSLFIVIINFNHQVNCDVSEVIQQQKSGYGYSYEVPPGQQVIIPVNNKLPEVIAARQFSNQDNHNFFGYSYEKPTYNYLTPTVQPPLQDEVPSIPVTSSPPVFNPPPPQNDYLPPIFSDTPQIPTTLQPDLVQTIRPTDEYLTPSRPVYNQTMDEFQGYNYDPPKGRQRQIFQSTIPIQLELNEMHCLNNEYFRAVINVKNSFEVLPVLEKTNYSNYKCPISVTRSQIIINIKSGEFNYCGVEKCGAHELCLRVRFPHIGDLKTYYDEILTLQCRVQERIKEHLHTINLGASDINARKSNNRLHAKGGRQLPFRSDVAIYRRVSNTDSYTKIEPGGTVQLGEDLILRAQVNSGDGWNFTKLSDVKLHYYDSNMKQNKSQSLVLTSGCVNPLMKIVCPHQPTFDPPLGHRLNFKAIMFSGMKSGDQMLMTIRILGCVLRNDCHLETSQCPNLNNHKLWKRSARSNHIDSFESSEVSKVSFKIVIPSEQENVDYELVENSADRLNGTVPSTNTTFIQSWWPIIVIVGICCFAIFAILLALHRRSRHY